MDDYVGVSYIDLLNKSLNRCIIDWKCFAERIVSETNKNNLRIALIQYCRGQREIFLKLKVLFDLVKYQKNIDKLLQYSSQYDQYIEDSIQNISRNICVIENNIMPAPNLSLGIDLLSNYNYTRIPSMIGEISKSSCDNTIPIMKIDPETIDLCLNRLQIHFYVLFKLSRCSTLCKVNFNNGVCQFTRDKFFHIDLLYDFNQYQITKLKLFVNNKYVPNVVNIINYILNHYLAHKTKGRFKTSTNTADDTSVDNKLDLKHNNIFDIIYNITNNYVGKLIMKYLYKQVIDYSNNWYIVSHYEHRLNDGTLNSPDLNKDLEFSEELRVECYRKYKNKGANGVTMVFTRKDNGDVDLRVDELELSYLRIHDYNLDHWFHLISDELEKYQLKSIKNIMDCLNEQHNQLFQLLNKKLNNKKMFESNSLFKTSSLKELYLMTDSDHNSKDGMYSIKPKEIWINRFDGSLNFYGHQGEFNLNEALGLMKLDKMRCLLNLKYKNYLPAIMITNPVNASMCPVCTYNNETSLKEATSKGKSGDTGKHDYDDRDDFSYNDLIDVLLDINKYLVHKSNNDLHIVATYKVYPLNSEDAVNGAKEDNFHVNGLLLLLDVCVHDYVVIENSIVVFDGTHESLGRVELGTLYQFSMNKLLRKLMNSLLDLEFMNRKASSKSNIFADRYTNRFVTDPVTDLNNVVFKFNDLEMSIEFKDGLFHKVNKGDKELILKKDENHVLAINHFIDQFK